jgi:GntR family transcriptional regulator/MocR family aminotransferase
MLPFQTLIATSKESPLPIFRQITDRLVELVRAGMLKPGVFLPGTRQMGELLLVNRKTVIKVYEELLAQNWLESEPRKGYRVTANLPETRPRSFQPGPSYFQKNYKYQQNVMPHLDGEQRLKFSDILIDDGYPDPRLSPYREMNRVYSEQTTVTAQKQLLPYRPQGGLRTLKSAASELLNDSRGLNISSDEIVITRGGQMPLYITASVLIKPGDKIAVAEINDPMASQILEHAGGELIRIRHCEDGIDLDDLEKTLQIHRITLLHIQPHNQYPTGAVMSAEKRRKLLALIRTYNFWVIEEDLGYDFDFESKPILPLASADHGGKLIYIGNFDRTISRSIKLGFLIACPEILARASYLQGLMDHHGEVEMETMLCKMIISGDFDRHLIKSKKLYNQRCNILCEQLMAKLGHVLSFSRPKAGLGLWLKFRENFPLDKFLKATSRQGLFWEYGHHVDNSLRFGFASLSEKDIKRAVEIMHNCTLNLSESRICRHSNFPQIKAMTA